MAQYHYKTIVRQAKPRTGETLEGAVAYARGYSGGGGGSGSIDPGSVGSNLSIVAGDRILVEETQGVIRTMVKISHAVPKEEDIDSQTTAEDGVFVKNLHLDKQGHIVKAEVESVGNTFDKRYLRKDQPDETNFRVTFRDGVDFGDFVEGFLGSGGRIDRNGHCWLGGMHLREFLEVPELRFNRIDVVSGELWNAVAFGLIESVDTAAYIVTLKLEDGERSGLHVNDLCRGIFHNLGGNETTTGKDACGFDRMPGFSTSYFMPVQIIDEKRFKYSLRPGSTVHPCAAMKFAVYGNTTDKARQSSAYSTRNYKRFLCNVDTWEIKPQHIGVQIGDLTGLVIDGQDLGTKSIYLDNVYFGKNILQTKGLKESLRGADAYTTGLDRYAMATNTPVGQLPTDIAFTTFATKGTQPIAYASISGEGKYTVSVASAMGCTVAQAGNLIRIATFTAQDIATVTVVINCEGLVSYRHTFTLTRVKNGQDGNPGAKGDLIRKIYRRSAQHPGLPYGEAPSGWSFDPYEQASDPLWMCQATFSASGTLLTSWSYPVKISGETGRKGDKGDPGRDGQPGAQGPAGPGICFRGDYDSFKYYNGTTTYVDVVRYAGRYYKAHTTSGVFRSVHPTNTSKWELMNSFENVATRLLIAEEANIAGWLFSNQYIVSQNRNVGLDGHADSGPRFWAGANYQGRSSAPFRVYDDGSIHSVKGYIGGFTISDKGLFASDKVIQGSVYSNPKGLWLDAHGSCRVVDENGNRFGLLHCGPANSMLTLRIDHTFNKFIECVFSSGTARREFSVKTRQCKGDASWFRRWLIRISHMPLAQHVPFDGIGDVQSNPQADGNYYVMWNAKTGYLWVKPQ